MDPEIFNFNRFPASAMLGQAGDEAKKLDRDGKIKLRGFLFERFIKENPARATAFSQLDEQSRRILANGFEQHITDTNPDYFSIEVDRPAPRIASAAKRARLRGEPRTREVPLRTAIEERYYDRVKEGDVPVETLGREERALIGEMAKERNDTETLKRFEALLPTRLVMEAPDGRTGVGIGRVEGARMVERQLTPQQLRREEFMEGAVYSPLRETGRALWNMRGSMALGGTPRLYQEAMRDPSEEPEKIAIDRMLPKPGEDVMQVPDEEIRKRRDEAAKEARELGEDVFGTGTPRTLGAVAGMVGTTATGYGALRSATQVARLAPQGAREAAKIVGSMRGAAGTMALEGGLGAAYAEVLPGIAAEMLGQPDNKILTAAEAAAVGTLFGAGVDLARAWKGKRSYEAMRLVHNQITDAGLRSDIEKHLLAGDSFLQGKLPANWRELPVEDVARLVDEANLERNLVTDFSVPATAEAVEPTRAMVSTRYVGSKAGVGNVPDKHFFELLEDVGDLKKGQRVTRSVLERRGHPVPEVETPVFGREATEQESRTALRGVEQEQHVLETRITQEREGLRPSRSAAQTEVETIGVKPVLDGEAVEARRIADGNVSQDAIEAGNEIAMQTRVAQLQESVNAYIRGNTLGVVPESFERYINEVAPAMKELFLKRQNLPKAMFQAFTEGQASKRAALNRVNQLMKDYRSVYRRQTKEMQKLIDETAYAVFQDERALARATRLPVEVRHVMQQLRHAIAEGGEQFIELGMVRGAAGDPSFQAWRENTRSYLNRAYAAHSNPKYTPSPIDREAAENYVRVAFADVGGDSAEAQARRARLREIQGKYRAEWDKIDEVHRENLARRARGEPELKVPELPEHFKSLDVWDEADRSMFLRADKAREVVADLLGETSVSFYTGGSKVLGKDVGVLMGRKDLALPIRRVLGELTNYEEAVSRTLSKQASLIENHKTQELMREIGLKMGVFREGYDPLTPVRMGTQSIPSSYDVWKGVYAQEDVAKAMSAFLGAAKKEFSPGGLLFTLWDQGVAYAKLSKTIGNFPFGYVTNYIGALMNEFAQGSFNLMNWQRGLRAMIDQHFEIDKLGRGRIGLNVGSKEFKEQSRELANKLIKHNLVGQNISVRDIQAGLSNVVEMAYAREGTGAFKKALESFGSMWAMGDDVGKYMAWLSESHKYRFRKQFMPPDAFDSFIAERVAMTRQMYDRVPKWMRELSKKELGVIPFVSFNYDQGRIIINTARIIADDFNNARKALAAGNIQEAKAWSRVGANRLASFTAIGVMGGTIGREAVHWANGISDDDAKMAKAHLPPFFRNQTYALVQDPRTGKLRYQILSYNFPNDTWFRLFRVGMELNGVEDAAARQILMDEGISQIFGDGVFLMPFVRTMVWGKDQYGNPIEDDSFDGRARKFVSEAYTPLGPRRLWQTMTNPEGGFGTERNWDDFINHSVGARTYTVDLKRGAEPKYRQQIRDMRDLNDAAVTHQRNFERGRLSEDKYRRRVTSLEQSYRYSWNILQDMLKSNVEWGVMTGDENVDILRNTFGLSNEDIRDIMANDFDNYFQRRWRLARERQ